MPRYAVQVSFQGASGLAKDQYENVWHFGTVAGGETPGGAKQLAARISTFYNAVPTGHEGISSFLDSNILPHATIKVYDESGVRAGPPIYSNTFAPTLSAGAGGFPEQVACCLSYYSTSNSPRHRGRIYLGPFNSLSMAVTARGGPSAELVTSMIIGAQALIASATDFSLLDDWLLTDDGITIDASAIPWAIRSGGGTKATTKTGLVTYEAVQHGWVDNEWDIQRRRGLKATSRSSF